MLESPNLDQPKEAGVRLEHPDIWNKVLSEDEKIVHEFGVSDNYMMLGMAISIIIGLLAMWFFGRTWISLIIFGSIFFYFAFYLKAARAYALTNKRVVIHTGWLSHKTTSLDYEKITDITVEQGFLERKLLKIGGISVHTADVGQKDKKMDHIDDPYELKKRLDVLRKNYS